jgi:hypothetical protein
MSKFEPKSRREKLMKKLAGNELKTVTVNSLSEYLDVVFGINEMHISTIYRGLSDKDYRIVSSAHRLLFEDNKNNNAQTVNKNSKKDKNQNGLSDNNFEKDIKTIDDREIIQQYINLGLIECDKTKKKITDKLYENYEEITDKALLFRNYHEGLLSEMKRRNDVGYNKESQIETLAFAQHHSKPTNLIDFTTSPLVALWFACHEKEEEDYENSTDAVVVFINAFLKTVDENFDINEQFTLWETEYMPRMYIPPIFDRRIHAQQSVLLFNVDGIVQPELYGKIIIDGKHRKEIFDMLETIGITAQYLFPDFEGFVMWEKISSKAQTISYFEHADYYKSIDRNQIAKTYCDKLFVSSDHKDGIVGFPLDLEKKDPTSAIYRLSAAILRKMNLNSELAYSDIQKCKEIMENNGFNKSTDYINVLCDEARILSKRRDYDGARQLLTRANELLDTLTDKPRCFSTQSYVDKSWAEYYQEKAVGKLEKGIDLNKGEKEPFYLITKELWDNFIKIYNEEDKTDDEKRQKIENYIKKGESTHHRKKYYKQLLENAYDNRINIKDTFDKMKTYAKISIEMKIRRYGYLHNVLSYNLKATAYQYRKIAAFDFCVYAQNEDDFENKDQYFKDCIEYLYKSQQRYELHDSIKSHYKVFQNNPDQHLHRPPDTSNYIPKSKPFTAKEEKVLQTVS